MGNYSRVVPRDFFNEAKLLKCLGRLSLFMLERAWISDVIGVDESGLDDGFDIHQNQDGDIYVANYVVYLHRGGKIDLLTRLNSKKNYPLLYIYDNELGTVFDEEGNLSEEFKTFLKGDDNG